MIQIITRIEETPYRMDIQLRLARGSRKTAPTTNEEAIAKAYAKGFEDMIKAYLSHMPEEDAKLFRVDTDWS